MEPKEFTSSTWELFGASQGVLAFVDESMGKTIASDIFWKFWKAWKQFCIKTLTKSDIHYWRRMGNGELFLKLPGEPY